MVSELLSRAFPNKWLGQPATAQNVVPAVAGFPINGTMLLHAIRLVNRSATPGVCAAVALLKDSAWVFGQWTNATTLFTDDTTDAQSAATNDAALETNTSGDGCIIGATVPFNAVSLDVTTAGAAASDIHSVEYWNGSAWTAMAASSFLVDIASRAAVWSAGEQTFLFEAPMDWAVGGSGTNVPSTKYNIRIKRTPTTPSAAALARLVYVGRILWSVKSVAAGAESLLNIAPSHLGLSDTYYAAVGLFVATADNGNVLQLLPRVE